MSNTKVKSVNKKEANLATKQLFESLKAVVIALLIGVILMAITNPDSIGDFFTYMFDYSFGSLSNFANFLGNLSYMIPLGLALAVSFRIGVFNIGAAGQVLAGGFASLMVATSLDIGQFGWIIVLLVGIIVGMLVALLIGLLKTRFSIHEVISSIMINWILFYLIRNASPNAGQTWTSIYGQIIDGNSLRQDWLFDVFGANSITSSINVGIIIAILLVPVFIFAYKKTNWGFKQTVLGGNSNSAIYLGINKNAEILKSMAISGALAGLAGAIYFIGFKNPNDLNGVISSGTKDIPGFAFNGITIALLGFNSPIGIILSSSLLSILNPLQDLDKIAGNIHIVDAMIAIMIIMMARAHYAIYYKERKVKIVKQKSKAKEEVA